MICVIDASIACKWFVQEPESEAALSLLNEDANTFIAPDVIRPEILNVLWKKVQQRAMTRAIASQAAGRIDAYFDTIFPADSIAPRALAIALDLGHPVYDCLYLALAEVRAVDVLTADLRFARALKGTRWARYVRLLA